MKRIILAISALIITLNVVAQSETISGTVIDKESGEPLVGAVVKHPTSGLEVLTDFDGNFTINTVASGINKLTISYVSYEDFKMNRVMVKDGEATKLNIKMQRSKGQTNTSNALASLSGNNQNS